MTAEPTGLPLFDAMESKRRRDAGRDQVLRHWQGWQAHAYEAVIGLKVRNEWPGGFTGEDIRRHLIERGIKPEKPQAWGAFIGKLARRQVIEETGRMAPMKDVSSHARRTFVYRWKT